MKLKFIFIFFTLLYFSASAFAQIKIQEDRTNYASGNGDNKAEAAINDTDISLVAPIPLWDDNLIFLIGKRNIKTIKIRNFENFTFNNHLVEKKDFPKYLYKTSWGFGAKLIFGKDAITFNRMIGYATDEEDINSRDETKLFQIGYTPDYKDKGYWTYNIARTQAFGDSQIIPMLGYDYKSGGTNFKMLLPVKINLRQDIGNDWAFTWSEKFEGGSYRLTEEEPWNDSIIKFSNLKSRIGVGYYVAGPLLLNFGMGWVSHRIIELRDDDNDKISGGDVSLKDSLMYSISLSLVKR